MSRTPNNLKYKMATMGKENILEKIAVGNFNTMSYVYFSVFSFLGELLLLLMLSILPQAMNELTYLLLQFINYISQNM